MSSSIPRQCACYLREAIRRIAVGHDQDAGVGALIAEEMDGQLDEVVAIARDEAAGALRRSFQLLFVLRGRLAFFERASRVDAAVSKQDRDPWAEVRVEVVLHRWLRP